MGSEQLDTPGVAAVTRVGGRMIALTVLPQAGCGNTHARGLATVTTPAYTGCEVACVAGYAARPACGTPRCGDTQTRRADRQTRRHLLHDPQPGDDVVTRFFTALAAGIRRPRVRVDNPASAAQTLRKHMNPAQLGELARLIAPPG